ncbi:Hypothetical predicted protein [Paramuricea clavata]|uniref:Uncharacterized protein n=1 Tax=Paramuricea clavata TaxID=317549 RepID=A0A6S7G139_PARCT|nr:Hypothetical predicted protein [Paramuricea clavata]
MTLKVRRSGEDLCEDLEKLQKRALHIIFPTLPYAEALVEAGVDSLFNRRQKLFNDIANDESHKLYTDYYQIPDFINMTEKEFQVYFGEVPGNKGNIAHLKLR